MRVKNFLLGAATVAALGMVATSCTNEMVSPYPGQASNKSMLVHDPDLYAWSGNDFFNNGTRADGVGVTGITVETVETDLLDQEEENKIIDNYLPEQNGNLKEGIIENFLFKADDDITFELYPVYCQTHTEKHVGIFYYDNSGVYHEIENVFDGITQWAGRTRQGEWQWDEEKQQGYNKIYFIGKKISIPKGYVFGFFWNGNLNNDYPADDKSTTYYSIDKWNTECYASDGNGTKIEPETFSKLHGVTFELNGKTYLGLEDWTDFDFQDLVLTCPENLTEVPVDKIPEKGETWTEDFPGGDGEVITPPVDPEPDPDPELCPVPGCGHPKHTGHACEKCPEGTDCNPGDLNNNFGGDNNGVDDPTTPTDPNDPNQPNTPGNTSTPYGHNDEVEVNYSINDVHTDANGQKYENADLWTKLSIHVRKGTDVKITVPLPKKYFCESDDFAILQDHGNGIYTGMGVGDETYSPEDHTPDYTHSMIYTITNDATNQTWTVTLTVNIKEEYMEIVTDGIDQDLIDYLYAKNGDGMNFEIWNYYQTETVEYVQNGVTQEEEKHVRGTLSQEDYEAFQGYLNRSTIEFLDADPSYYINAFGYNWSNGNYNVDIRPGDCTVTPVSDSGFEMFPNFCYHLNGTPWNIIWTKNVDKTSEDYEGHTVTPKPAVAVNKYNN